MSIKSFILIVAIGHFSLWPGLTLGAPGLIKNAVIPITENASSWFGSYGNLYLNSLSYSQDNLITYNGWQYATYYDSQRRVAVARRSLPTGSWESLSLTDYTQTTDDTHNNISLGISTDGRLHLSFDHHGNTLHYRMSVEGLANDPESFAWNASQFQNTRDNLGAGAINMVTYPRFMLSESGVFLLALRIGSSGDGDSYLYRYNNDGTWTTLGQFVNGGSENAYFHGMAFGGDRLHITWCWRATSDGTTNHDLLYAYSDDFGVTWRNNTGNFSSTTNSDPIALTDNQYKVWDIAQGTNLINQEGMIVDLQGRVHVISREDVGGTNRQFHYYRSLAGDWQRINTGIATIDWDNRSKIAFDTSGNVYAIMPNISIASASVDSNYQNWTTVMSIDQGKYFHTEPLIDPKGLLLAENTLHVFAQRGGSNTGSQIIDVIEYSLNTGDLGPLGSGPLGYELCGSEGETIALEGTQDIAFGANGGFAYLEGATGSITFDNATFGDPANGISKSGYCRASVVSNIVEPGLFPKPEIAITSNLINLKIPGPVTEYNPAQLTIYTFDGKIVLSKKCEEGACNISFKELGLGLHVLSLKSGSKMWTHKFTVLNKAPL